MGIGGFEKLLTSDILAVVSGRSPAPLRFLTRRIRHNSAMLMAR